MSLSATKRIKELEKANAILRSQLETEKLRSTSLASKLEQAKERIVTLTSK